MKMLNWLLPVCLAVAAVLFIAFQPTPTHTPEQTAQEQEWQACAATWSPLERRVFDGISYSHEAAITRLSHVKGGCAAARQLLRGLAVYPPDRRDDFFDLATSR